MSSPPGIVHRFGACGLTAGCPDCERPAVHRFGACGVTAGCSLCERAMQRVLDFATDYDQTADEARTELAEEGVDVDSFLARLRAKLPRGMERPK